MSAGAIPSAFSPPTTSTSGNGPSAGVAHPRAPHRARRCAACPTWCSSTAARTGGMRSGADLRRRRHGRSMGDAAARRTRWRGAAPRVRGLRALVGARASLPRRARRDPRARARPPRHQGGQHLHSVRPRGFRSRDCRTPACAPRSRGSRSSTSRSRWCRAKRSTRRCRSAGRRTTTTSHHACFARSKPGRAGDLQPTQELDWRCDLYSLAAMLRRYLPVEEWARPRALRRVGRPARYDDARSLIYRLRECHDTRTPQVASPSSTDRGHGRANRRPRARHIAVARLDASRWTRIRQPRLR